MKPISKLLLEDNGYLAQSERVSLYSVDFVNANPSEFQTFSEKLKANLKIGALSLSACDFYKCQPVVVESLFELVNSLRTLKSLCLAHNFPDQLDALDNFERMISILLLPALEEIDLSSNFLFRHHQKAILAIKDVFRKHPILKVIDLRGNKIGTLFEDGFKDFCDVLQTSQLETIVLAANELGQISERSFEKLFFALGQIASLKKLDLSSNDLSGKPLEIMINFLQRSNVETLLLNHCAIGLMQSDARTWEKLLKILSGRNRIKILDVGSNQLKALDHYIDNRSQITLIIRIAGYIRCWPILHRLVLSNNDLSEHSNVLLFLVKTLLMRNPGLGFHIRCALAQVEKDFSNTGYGFEMNAVIKDVEEYLEQQKSLVLLENVSGPPLLLSQESAAAQENTSSIQEPPNIDLNTAKKQMSP